MDWCHVSRVWASYAELYYTFTGWALYLGDGDDDGDEQQFESP